VEAASHCKSNASYSSYQKSNSFQIAHPHRIKTTIMIDLLRKT
jgi:hypothetical protein